MGPHCDLPGDRGEGGVGLWHPDSPLAAPSSFIEAFSGTLIPPEVFKGLKEPPEGTEF